MEPMQYVRLLRRRWLSIFLVTAIGAGLGYASTLLESDDTGPVVDYWAAGEVLIINAEATSQNIDLQRLSPFATGGDVPRIVAEARGVQVSDLIATLRTVSDRSEGTLTISAVANSAGDARNVAEQVTMTLLDELSSDAVATHDQALVDAEALVEDRVAAVSALNLQISALNARAAVATAIPEEEAEAAAEDGSAGLSADETDELRRLVVERDAGVLRVAESQNTLDGLQRNGPAPAALVRLEPVVPFRISEREFQGRLAQGAQADNNFVAGQVDLADTSSPSVSERLESPAARALLGALAGLVLGIALVAAHMRLDPRLRSRDQVETAFALPVLAEIPMIVRKQRKDGTLLARDQPRGAIAEAYRYLRSVLLFAKSGMANNQNGSANGQQAETAPLASEPEREVRVVMITSAGEGEGKTTTAVNLAVLMAEAGHNTILVNCDFRLPTAHKAFGLPYSPGTIADTGIKNLRFIADVRRGEDDTPGQVSERQRKLIRKAREMADLLILDTAPILATNDAIDILPVTDLVVLVAREAKTTREAAREARDLLIDRMGVAVAGVVVTAAGAGMGAGYYEKYRYGSYFRSDSPALWKVGAKLLGRDKKIEAPAPPAAAPSPKPKAPKPPKAKKRAKRREAKNGVPTPAAPRHQSPVAVPPASAPPAPAHAPPPAHIVRAAAPPPPPVAQRPSAVAPSPAVSGGLVAAPPAPRPPASLVDIDLTLELDDLFAPLSEAEVNGARHAQVTPKLSPAVPPTVSPQTNGQVYFNAADPSTYDVEPQHGATRGAAPAPDEVEIDIRE